MRKFLCCIWVVLSANSMMAEIPKAERNALIDFFKATNGDNWTNTWDIDADVSNWYGLKVVNDHVTEINLFRNNLNGIIPSSIGDFKELESLILAFNGITGELPDEITELPRLRVLKLEMNRIKGELPENIGDLVKLEELT